MAYLSISRENRSTLLSCINKAIPVRVNFQLKTKPCHSDCIHHKSNITSANSPVNCSSFGLLSFGLYSFHALRGDGVRVADTEWTSFPRCDPYVGVSNTNYSVFSLWVDIPRNL